MPSHQTWAIAVRNRTRRQNRNLLLQLLWGSRKVQQQARATLRERYPNPVQREGRKRTPFQLRYQLDVTTREGGWGSIWAQAREIARRTGYGMERCRGAVRRARVAALEPSSQSLRSDQTNHP